MKVRFIVSLIISMVLALIMSASIVDGLGARYLKSGLRGEDVRILQEYLSALAMT